MHKLLGTIPSFLIVAGFIFVFIFLIDSNNGAVQRQLQGQTYGRFNSCILSYPPDTRSANDIDHCWVQAMKDTGVSVKRYDQPH